MFVVGRELCKAFGLRAVWAMCCRLYRIVYPAPNCTQWMIFSLVGQRFGDQHERVGTTQFVLDRLSDLHDLRR
jgi:hypothetical protein